MLDSFGADLRWAESLFVIYIKNSATLYFVYEAIGGIVELLLWIHLSGCIFIFGARLCAAKAYDRTAREETIVGG